VGSFLGATYVSYELHVRNTWLITTNAMTNTYNVPTARDSKILENQLWMEQGGYVDNTASEVVTFMWQDYFQVSPTNEQRWALQDMRQYYEGLMVGLSPAVAEDKALCDIPF